MDFIERFKKIIYQNEITDAPEIFLESVALNILSLHTMRSLYIRWGYKKIYPNLWILLVAKSSLFRKSTCLDLFKKFIPDDLLLPNEYSSELLLKEISIKQKGVLLMDEILSTIKLWERDYAISVKSNLTSLFDCETSLKRKTMSYTVEIFNPFISIMAGSTPTWIKESIKEEDLASGFLPRFLLVYATKKEKSIRIPSSGNDSLFLPLRDFLTRMQEFLQKARNSSITSNENEIVFSPSAKKELEKYAGLLEDLIIKEGNGLSPFYARLLVYTVKLSILYFLSEDGNWKEFSSTSEILEKGLKISKNDIKRAISYSEKIRFSTEKLLSSLAFNKYQVLRNKILETLEIKEQISYSELLRKLKIKTRELREILETLIEEGSIQVEKPDGKLLIIKQKGGEKDGEI